MDVAALRITIASLALELSIDATLGLATSTPSAYSRVEDMMI